MATWGSVWSDFCSQVVALLVAPMIRKSMSSNLMTDPLRSCGFIWVPCIAWADRRRLMARGPYGCDFQPVCQLPGPHRTPTGGPVSTSKRHFSSLRKITPDEVTVTTGFSPTRHAKIPRDELGVLLGFGLGKSSAG